MIFKYIPSKSPLKFTTILTNGYISTVMAMNYGSPKPRAEGSSPSAPAKKEIAVNLDSIGFSAIFICVLIQNLVMIFKSKMLYCVILLSLITPRYPKNPLQIPSKHPLDFYCRITYNLFIRSDENE